MLPEVVPEGSIFFSVWRCNRMKIKDILSSVKKLAPEEFQCSWDNSGLQIAGTASEARKVAVALDPKPETVAQCLDWGAEVMVAHHPLYRKPVAPNAEGPYLDVLRRFLAAGAWLYSAHTSLDSRPDGPAFWLAEHLALQNTRFLDVEHRFPALEVSFLPSRPLRRELAEQWAENPGVHAVSQTRAGEVRIICDRAAWPEIRGSVEFALQESQEYYVRELQSPALETGIGMVGDLPEAMPWQAFTEKVTSALNCRGWTECGPIADTISRVAFCGGSGGSLISRAARLGADVLVTGDVKYHPALEADIRVMDVGHFSLEEEMMRRFANELAESLDSVEVRFFEAEDPFSFHEK